MDVFLSHQNRNKKGEHRSDKSSLDVVNVFVEAKCKRFASVLVREAN
jgi:hypothetical protein